MTHSPSEKRGRRCAVDAHRRLFVYAHLVCLVGQGHPVSWGRGRGYGPEDSSSPISRKGV